MLRDFDAGKLLLSTAMETLEDQLFKPILKVVEKEKLTENEKQAFRDIAIVKTGMIL